MVSADQEMHGCLFAIARIPDIDGKQKLEQSLGGSALDRAGLCKQMVRVGGMLNSFSNFIGRAPGMLGLPVLSVAIGAVVATAAMGFVEAVEWLNDVLLVSQTSKSNFVGSQAFLIGMTLFVPTAGGLVVGAMLTWLSSEPKPLGPSDVIRAVQLRTGMAKLRAGLLSTGAALVSLGSGASVGQYGPVVYLGAILGNTAWRLSKVRSLPSIAMACGVAAAISTAFNAPIAGLVFAHEAILRHYSLKAFVPTTIAAASGYVANNVLFDRPPLLPEVFAGVDRGVDFMLFGIIGVLSAGIAIIFMRATLGCLAISRKTGLHPVVRTGLAGLAVGIAGLWLPEVIGVGTGTLQAAKLPDMFTAPYLLVLIAVKLVLSAICLGFGFAGGVLGPALVIGSLFGALCWHLGASARLIEGSGVAVYAVCGMVAVASPVVGAPLTMILLVLELTGSYDLSISAMVAVVVSNFVTSRVFGRSIFDRQLLSEGIDLSRGRDHARLSEMLVGEVATQDFARAEGHEPCASVQSRQASEEWTETFVCDSDNRLIGVLAPGSEGGEIPAAHAAREVKLVFHEHTTVFQAMEAFSDFEGGAVPLIDSKSERLLGVVTEAAVIKAFLSVLDSNRDEEHAPS